MSKILTFEKYEKIYFTRSTIRFLVIFFSLEIGFYYENIGFKIPLYTKLLVFKNSKILIKLIINYYFNGVKGTKWKKIN